MYRSTSHWTMDLTLLVLGLVAITGCTSNQSLDLASEMARVIEEHNTQVLGHFDDVIRELGALRSYEEKQWLSLIKIVSTSIEEHEQIVAALETENPPEFLGNVSVQTQKAYREIRGARNKLNALLVTLADRQQAIIEYGNQTREQEEAAAQPDVSPEKLGGLRRKLAEVFRQLDRLDSKIVGTIKPDQYGATADDISRLGGTIRKAISRRENYYIVWTTKLNDRLVSLDARMEELKDKLAELTEEKNRLVSLKDRSVEAVDSLISELEAARSSVRQNGQITSRMAQAVVESIRHDVQIANVARMAVNIALKATTGLSLANVVSEPEAEKIGQLISSAGQILGTVSGISIAESEQADKDKAKIEEDA